MMRVINLLPRHKQEELRYETVLHGLYAAVWFSVLSFALVFAAQGLVKIYLEREYSRLQKDAEQLRGQVNKKENAEVKAKIQAINDVIGDYKILADGAPKWSKVLRAFAALPPEGVKVSSFSVDAQKKSINIMGISPTREKVIEFYERINRDDKNFANVDYPLENITKAADVSFHFTFYIRDSLLK